MLKLPGAPPMMHWAHLSFSLSVQIHVSLVLLTCILPWRPEKQPSSVIWCHCVYKAQRYQTLYQMFDTPESVTPDQHNAHLGQFALRWQTTLRVGIWVWGFVANAVGDVYINYLTKYFTYLNELPNNIIWISIIYWRYNGTHSNFGLHLCSKTSVQNVMFVQHICNNTEHHGVNAECRRWNVGRGVKCLNESGSVLQRASSAEPTLCPNVRSNIKPPGCLREQTHTSEMKRVIT